MGMASASASGSSAVDAHGSGYLVINKPNYALYAVAGIVILFLGFWFIKRK